MNSHLPMRSSPPLLSCAALAVFFLARAVSAEPLLDLTFDDPQGLLKTQPDGVAKITPEIAGNAATIASGTGGRAVPQIAEGPASERKGKGNECRLQTQTVPPFGSKPFFHASLEAGSATRTVGLGIIPGSAATSLSAMVRGEGPFLRIDGAVDFFFRMTASGGSPKFVVMTKVAQMGLVLSTLPETHQLTLKVFTSKSTIDLDGDKTGDKTSLEKLADGGIDSDVIYHGALVFRTEANGSISVNFCLEPGMGPLDPASSIVATIDGFWLLAESQKTGVDKFVINMGRHETSQQTLDIAALRLFSPAPNILPGLDGAQP